MRIGTAGWAIPRAAADPFPEQGTGLQRYAARFDCAEINSTFHRPHRESTLERWAAETPPDFRFAFKLSKTITHELRLIEAREPLETALAQAGRLGAKLGPLLLQLPPSLAFDPDVAGAFFGLLRERFDGPVACEPRHPEWFTAQADALLIRVRVARVAADPARVPGAAVPGGWTGLVYARLHGSPAVYRSPYGPEGAKAWADRLAPDAARAEESWCIFDNTASGAAAADALAMQGLAERGRQPD